MSAMAFDEFILEPAAYSSVRRDRRAAAIGLRQLRRVALGDLVLIEFENDATLHYQAQEMLYVERVTDPTTAAAEVSVYERLLPTATSVAATMMIQISDQDEVRAELTRLNGLHESVRLEVGPLSCVARDIPPPEEGPSTHTVSVHFLGFDLSPELVERLATGGSARLVIDHPAYQATAELSDELIGLLARDIQLAAA